MNRAYSYFFYRIFLRLIPAVTSLLAAAVAVEARAPKIIEDLAAQKDRAFDCKAQQEGGWICVSTTHFSFKYPLKIALLIPAGASFSAGAPHTGIVYFHGWRGVCESSSLDATSFVKTYRLLSQLNASNRTGSIVLVPLSQGKNDQHKSQLAPRFDSFVSAVESSLGLPRIQWEITGHSGAYAPIHTVLSSSSRKIKAAGFIDATYSSQTPSAVLRAQQKNPAMKVFSIHVPRSRTAAISLQISRDQRIKNKQVLESRTGGHCPSPKFDFESYLKFTGL